MPSGLTIHVGQMLRDTREKAGWTQGRLAEETGTSQPCLSRIERGRQAPGTDLLERLFAALGWQVRLRLEIRDSDLDDRIDRIGEVDDEERAATMRQFQWYLTKMRDLPYVIEGELGALLHGVPVQTMTLGIAVAERDVDELARWIMSIPNCTRWNPQWRDYGGLHPDPRLPGELRWRLGMGDLRVSVVPELPEPVRIAAGDQEYPVRPLDQIIDADHAVARVVGRVRARSA